MVGNRECMSACCEFDMGADYEYSGWKARNMKGGGEECLLSLDMDGMGRLLVGMYHGWDAISKGHNGLVCTPCTLAMLWVIV